LNWVYWEEVCGDLEEGNAAFMNSELIFGIEGAAETLCKARR
jgi:hypothetical protein